MSLESTSVIKFLDLLCEGPIKGIVAGTTDGLPDNIFFNETKLGGSYNKQLIDIEYSNYLGGATQAKPVIGESNSSADVIDLTNIISFSPPLEIGNTYNETVDANNEVTARRYDKSETGQNFQVRTITDTTVEKVSFVFVIPRLFSTAQEGLAQGQLFNATVRWTILITDSTGQTQGPDNSDVSAVINDFDYQVTGISTSDFVYQTPKIPLQGVGPWTVKVEKAKFIRATQDGTTKAITPDPTASILKRPQHTNNNDRGKRRDRGKEAAFEVSYFDFQDTPFKKPLENSRGNQLFWSAINTYRASRVNYKHTAMVAASIDTEEFQTLPSRQYLVEGLKVKIPSNAVPRTDGSLAFVGDFDGNVSDELFYTTCPVCCFVDLLTSTRYGIGDFVENENINWVDYYPLARYANERIPSQEVAATYTQTGDVITVTHSATAARTAHGLSEGDEVTLRFMGTSNSAKAENANNKFIFTVASVPSTSVFTVAAAATRSVSTAESVFSGKPEARFACNLQIAGQEQAYTVLQNMASIFRGMTYWQSNTVTAAGDHGELGKITDGTGEVPSSVVAPVHLYNNSNVIEGAFTYSYSSIKTRATVVKVRYNDPQNFYKPNIVCIEDIASREKYGYQVKEIIGFGCTSKSQATRLAKWQLETEKLNAAVVTFSTGLQGAMTFPGQIFAVADEMQQNIRTAGRISSATASAVVVDAAITIPSGVTASLTCTLSDGRVETKSVNLSVTSGTTISVSLDPFSSAPEAQSMYSLTWTKTGNTLVQQKFRCLSVADNGDGTFAVTGTEHNDSIYAAVDFAGAKVIDEPSDVTTFEDAPSKVTNLQLKFFPVDASNNFSFVCLASWKRGVTGITRNFHVVHRVGDGRTVFTETQRVTQLEIKDVPPNTPVQVEVVAQNSQDVFTRSSESVAVTATSPNVSTFQDPVGTKSGGLVIADVTVLPPSPSGLNVVTIDFTANQVSWIPPFASNTKDLIAEIRKAPLVDAIFSSSGTAPVFDNSVLISETEARSGSAVVTGGNGVYYLRFKNVTTGEFSATPASFSLDASFGTNHVAAMELIEGAASNSQFISGGGRSGGPLTTTVGRSVSPTTAKFGGLALRTSQQINVGYDNTNRLKLLDATKSGEYHFYADADAFYEQSFGETGRTSTINFIVEPFIVNTPHQTDASDSALATVNKTNVELYVRASQGVERKYVDSATDDLYIEQENNTDTLEMEQSSSGSLMIAVEETVNDFDDWVNLTGREELRGRYFQAKLVLTSDDSGQTPAVKDVSVMFYAKKRLDVRRKISTGSSGYTTVSFNKRFYKFYDATSDANPSVSIDIDAGSGADRRIAAQTDDVFDQFKVQVQDADSSSVVAGTISYNATGHGEEL